MTARNAIDNALMLLNYTAENGVEVPDEVALAITTADRAENQNTLTPEIDANFWKAYKKLSHAAQPVTIESLSPECAENTRIEKRSYSIWGNILLLTILPLSIASFATNSIINDLEVKADVTCKRETSLKCTTPALAGIPATEPTDQDLANQNDLEAAYQLMYFRLRWLDRLLLFVYPLDYLDQIFVPEKKSQRFNKAVWFARDLKERAQLTYGILSNYILPILYAMLGAVAYGLRNLSDHVATRTVFTYSLVRARARFRLAVLAGVVVGLFNDFTKGIALSPLAVAFLVGYAVEIFFSFVDAIVEASKKVKSTT
jgi:hypothetical protein